MCGIVGYNSLKKLDLDHKKILKELKHRGPDSQSSISLNLKKTIYFWFYKTCNSRSKYQIKSAIFI